MGNSLFRAFFRSVSAASHDIGFNLAPALLRAPTGTVARRCTPHVPAGRHIQVPHSGNNRIARDSGGTLYYKIRKYPFRSGFSIPGHSVTAGWKTYVFISTNGQSSVPNRHGACLSFRLV